MIKNPCAPFVLISLLLHAACSSTLQTRYYQRDVDKPFGEVIDDAIFAITERNFRLSAHLHIGAAIRDRENAGFPDYEVLLYCNLEHTKKMLTLEPTTINYCPGRINIRSANDKVYITAVLWPEPRENAALAAQMRLLNDLAREIVDYAAEQWLSQRAQ